MSNLNIVYHNNGEISIKDIGHKLDISESKWDALIDLILEKHSHVFFYGVRLDYFNDDLMETIQYASDDFLMNRNDNFQLILFKVKEANVRLSRGLIGKIWGYYESPSLIFLKDKSNQDSIVSALKASRFYDSLLNSVNGICMLYQSFEEDVLWIKTNDINVETEIVKKISF
ncbi:hypothetical protein [Pedobacter sp. B4-66]|uniref:hypothetical protein n=1 Tax=Pedobacter sp. B4-66 TaxID=2817280 RepID=UPI001BD982B3|nr:hypothetical protein [Pedobacter sp. B4-66]